MYQENNSTLSQTQTQSYSSTQWTFIEDKLFEKALVMYPDEVPDRWKKIAEQVPGKSPGDVKEHFEVLVHDVSEIDSGRVALPRYKDESSPSDWDSVGQISFGSKQRHGGEPERKKGTPWTEEEHKLFLIGLSKFGKGDWRSISRNVVVTRTPTQVASHAQKYFLRQSAVKKERKRSSIHDITTVDSNSVPVSVDQSSVGLPVDQDWIPPPGGPGHQQPHTLHQFPPPNQFPSQGGSMGYQNYGFPM